MADNTLSLIEFNHQLQDYLDNFVLDQKQGGCALSIYHQGELITALGAGVARIATPSGDSQIAAPFSPTTLSLNFSTGKGILVTLIHCLVSQNLLDYDRPIADYWQNFGKNGKQAITLRHILSHQSGLFDITHITQDAKDMLDWQAMLHKVETMPVDVRAMQVQSVAAFVAYSALVSGWILGGLIEKVTVLPLQSALEKYLLQPLDLVGQVYMGVPVDKTGQVATPFRDKEDRSKPIMVSDSRATLDFYHSLPIYPLWQQHTTTPHTKLPFKHLTTQQINSLYFDPSKIDINDYKSSLVPVGSRQFNYYHSLSLQAKIPAANTVATSHALATIYAMLTNGGEWQGTLLIRAEVFEQLCQVQNQQQDNIMPATMQWRLGYHRVFSLSPHTQNAFGHMGYNGSMAWCDPSRKLAVAFVHNYDVTMMNDIRQFIINESVLDYFN